MLEGSEPFKILNSFLLSGQQEGLEYRSLRKEKALPEHEERGMWAAQVYWSLLSMRRCLKMVS